MGPLCADDLVRLIEQKFDDEKQAIAALEAALDAEAKLDDWPLREDRSIVRGRLLLRLGDEYLERPDLRAFDTLLRACNELADKAPVLWARAQRSLAGGYSLRISGHESGLKNLFFTMPGGDREKAHHFERMIEAHEAALTVYTREAFPIAWREIQMSLASAYRIRINGKKAENIERAIALIEAVLKTYTGEDFTDREARARTRLSLAVVYLERICGERADNIERAIGLCDAALLRFPAGPQSYEWAETQNVLAMAYQERLRGERADNIEQAIGFCEAALTVFTRERYPVELAETQGILGIAYQKRIHGERADNIERAIGFCEAALTQLTTQRYPREHAMTMRNLATAYKNRLRGERADNIQRAERLYHEASRDDSAGWASARHGLALLSQERIDAGYWASSERWQRFAERAEAENVVEWCEQALTVRTREDFPRQHLETACHLGQVLLIQRNWRRSAAVLADARETFALLLGQGLDEPEVRGLIELAGGLFANAAYAAWAIGETEEAFELACRGRARLLAMALCLEPRGLPPERRRRLGALRREIRQLSRVLDRSNRTENGRINYWTETGGTDALDRLTSLRGELSQLIDVITGDSRPGVTSLARAAAIVGSGGAIILPIATEIGGKLFIVTADRLAVHALPNLSKRRLRDFIHGTDDRLGWLDNFAPKLTRERKILVSKFSDDLWRLFDQPLGELLSPLGTQGSLSTVLSELGIKQGSRLIFLPTEGLSFLPLGLMSDQSSGRRLIDDYEIVYSPTLEAIDQSRVVAHREASLAAIINPTGDLSYAPIEGQLVAGEFPRTTSIMLDQHTATPEAALLALKGKTYWHFSTHGTFDFIDARRSALMMSDGAKLSLGDLLEIGYLDHPRLVVLSACESGLHEISRTPDEFIGFPGAFMAMGAAAILGTLWPVNDLASTLLIARFYELHRRQGLPPPTALRQAQLWLRDARRSELMAYVDKATQEARLDAAQVQQMKAAIAGARNASDGLRFFDGASAPPTEPTRGDRDSDSERPFAHPIYWGGFILNGL